MYNVYCVNVDPVTVTVTPVSDNSLSVSWVDSASGGSTHLPTDTFTITATPSCRDGQSGFTQPDPQTVPYDAASTVLFTGLGTKRLGHPLLFYYITRRA